MTEEKKKGLLDRAIDAVTNRDEKAALEKAQKETADLRAKLASEKSQGMMKQKAGTKTTRKGVTTGNLKLRSGPGMQYDPPIGWLTPDTELEILSEEGDWLHVIVGGKEGYVGKKYVKFVGGTVAGKNITSQVKSTKGTR